MAIIMAIIALIFIIISFYLDNKVNRLKDEVNKYKERERQRIRDFKPL
jgi:preprotein translocase subunit SecG